MDNTTALSWGNFMGFIIAGIFFLVASLVSYYSRQNPILIAERFKWKNIYIFGKPKTWEVRYKYIPILSFMLAIFCFLGALVILLLLIF